MEENQEFNIIEIAKWNSVKDISKKTAMKNYIKKVKELYKNINY